MRKWGEKPYHSLDYMLRERFGEKVYKVTLNGGMSCPNRDGKIGTRGCIFCSAGGSGDFAADAALSITDQIEGQIAILSQKRPIHKYIAYFQAYTNTYAPVEYLEKIFTEAITHPKVVALSIGTRPDCLSPEIVELLSRLNRQKPVWVELGLQTIHETTAQYIRRGYPLSVFNDAVQRLRKEGIEVIVHTILGLPRESNEDILATRESSYNYFTCFAEPIWQLIMRKECFRLMKEMSICHCLSNAWSIYARISSSTVLPEMVLRIC